MNTTMSLASAAAFALLHSLWQLALVALLAWASLALMRGTSARARHAVGMGWLGAMLAAPVATFASYWSALAPAGPLDGAWLPTPGVVAGSGSATVLAHSWSLWLLGVALMVVRQFGGWRAMRRIEDAPSLALPGPWQQRVDVLRHALGITRTVTVRMAEHVASPFTAHVLRPLVWLPLALLTQLPRDQVEALLAHELAHVKRLDWCWNALQCAIEALLFHHPAMWWLSRRIREEREHACDDLAVAVCGDPVVLAEALAGLQRRRQANPQLGFARAGLAAEGGSLMKRVAHLLSATPARPGWRWPGVLLLLLCSGTLLAMQVAPPASILINLRTEASSQGALTPGNFREFTGTYLADKKRYYRISMDAAGQVHETYTEDGQPRPIDAGVHAWLASVSAMSGMDATGAARDLPDSVPPPVPALPPLPPLPPRHGAVDSDEFQVLMATLQADPQVIARTGQPVALDRASFHGSIHTWGARDFHLWGIDDPVGGKAAFTVTLAGPLGRVDVAWSGKTDAGTWKADSMTLSPPR